MYTLVLFTKQMFFRYQAFFSVKKISAAAQRAAGGTKTRARVRFSLVTRFTTRKN